MLCAWNWKCHKGFRPISCAACCFSLSLIQKHRHNSFCFSFLLSQTAISRTHMMHINQWWEKLKISLWKEAGCLMSRPSSSKTFCFNSASVTLSVCSALTLPPWQKGPLTVHARVCVCEAERKWLRMNGVMVFSSFSHSHCLPKSLYLPSLKWLLSDF